MYIHMSVCVTREKRGHTFKREQGERTWEVSQGQKGRRNDVIILKYLLTHNTFLIWRVLRGREKNEDERIASSVAFK